jgi:hypothetical protein
LNLLVENEYDEPPATAVSSYWETDRFTMGRLICDHQSLEYDMPMGTTTRTFLILTRLSLMDKLSPIVIGIVIVIVIIMLSRSEEGILNIDSYSRYFSIDEKLQIHVFSRFYLAKLMAPHMQEETRILRTRVLDQQESLVDTISTSLLATMTTHFCHTFSHTLLTCFLFHLALNVHQVDTTSANPSREP